MIHSCLHCAIILLFLQRIQFLVAHSNLSKGNFTFYQNVNPRSPSLKVCRNDYICWRVHDEVSVRRQHACCNPLCHKILDLFFVKARKVCCLVCKDLAQGRREFSELQFCDVS